MINLWLVDFRCKLRRKRTLKKHSLTDVCRWALLKWLGASVTGHAELSAVRYRAGLGELAACLFLGQGQGSLVSLAVVVTVMRDF